METFDKVLEAQLFDKEQSLVNQFLGCPEKITKIPFSKYAKFALSTLNYIFKLLKEHKIGSPQTLNSMLKNDIQLFEALSNIYPNEQQILSLITRITNMLKNWSSDPEKYYKELGHLASCMWLVLRSNLERIHAALFIARDGTEQTSSVFRILSKEIEKYDENFQIQYNFLEEAYNMTIFEDIRIQHFDAPFFTNNDCLNVFLDFAKQNSSPYPKCHTCDHIATVFAYPCSCPVSCTSCWKEGTKSSICPVCGKPMTQFVVTSN